MGGRDWVEKRREVLGGQCLVWLPPLQTAIGFVTDAQTRASLWGDGGCSLIFCFVTDR